MNPDPKRSPSSPAPRLHLLAPSPACLPSCRSAGRRTAATRRAARPTARMAMRTRLAAAGTATREGTACCCPGPAGTIRTAAGRRRGLTPTSLSRWWRCVAVDARQRREGRNWTASYRAGRDPCGGRLRTYRSAGQGSLAGDRAPWQAETSRVMDRETVAGRRTEGSGRGMRTANEEKRRTRKRAVRARTTEPEWTRHGELPSRPRSDPTFDCGLDC
jgi:hypothetical protein